MPAIFSVLRKTFARESLPPPPEPGSRESAHRRTRALRLLFAIEPLARDPERHVPRRRTLAPILAPERLPLDPERPRPRRARWLRWLFALERLDPP